MREMKIKVGLKQDKMKERQNLRMPAAIRMDELFAGKDTGTGCPASCGRWCRGTPVFLCER